MTELDSTGIQKLLYKEKPVYGLSKEALTQGSHRRKRKSIHQMYQLVMAEAKTNS